MILEAINIKVKKEDADAQAKAEDAARRAQFKEDAKKELLEKFG